MIYRMLLLKGLIIVIVISCLYVSQAEAESTPVFFGRWKGKITSSVTGDTAIVRGHISKRARMLLRYTSGQRCEGRKVIGNLTLFPDNTICIDGHGVILQIRKCIQTEGTACGKTNDTHSILEGIWLAPDIGEFGKFKLKKVIR